MLRLVKPSEPAKPRTKQPRHESRVLSAEEQQRAKQALRNLVLAFGSRGALAAALGVAPQLITDAVAKRGRVSAALLIRAMRASGLSLAELLGGPVAADRCRACGKVRAA